MGDVNSIAMDPHTRYHDYPPECGQCESYRDGTKKDEWRRFETEEEARNSLPEGRTLCCRCMAQRKKHK